MTASPTPCASVIIPTRNGMPLLEQCLAAVLAQDTSWDFEVVAIDSSSTDGTWELLERMPVRGLHIRPEDFNHGATRNFGAEHARGKFLVFLVQDAVPADTHWLRRLVEAADAPGAAGSYSRQLHWATDSILVRWTTHQAMPQPAKRLHQQLSPSQRWDNLSPTQKFNLSTFRNSASCMRREVWAQHPFRPLPYGEDLDWGQRVVQAGYSIVYEPSSCVFHSHDRSSLYELKRAYADHELVGRLFGYRLFPRLANAAISWVRMSVDATRSVYAAPAPLRQRLALASRAQVAVGARHIGTCLGARAASEPPKTRLWRRIDSWLRRGV